MRLRDKKVVLFLSLILTISLTSFVVYLSYNSMKSKTSESTHNVKKDLSDDDYETGVYMKTHPEICKQCKLRKISSAKIGMMGLKTVDTIHNNEIPLCYNAGKHKECCTVEKHDTTFGCPEFCFEEVRDKLNHIEKKDERRYKDVLKKNSYCNKF